MSVTSQPFSTHTQDASQSVLEQRQFSEAEKKAMTPAVNRAVAWFYSKDNVELLKLYGLRCILAIDMDRRVYFALHLTGGIMIDAQRFDKSLKSSQQRLCTPPEGFTINVDEVYLNNVIDNCQFTRDRRNEHFCSLAGDDNPMDGIDIELRELPDSEAKP